MRRSIRRTLVLYGLVASGIGGLGIATYATQTVSDIVRHERARTTAIEAASPPVLGSPYARSRLRGLMLFSIGWSAAVGLTWAWLAGRVVLAPLRQLATAAVELPDALPDSSEATGEVDAVARSFRRALRAVTREKEEVEIRNAKLAALQLHLAQSDKLASLGSLAAGIAHEIGNPLAAVMGYLHILRAGVTPEIQADVLERSTTELGRIHTTLKRMLAYARPETPDEPLGPIPVSRIVVDTVELVRAHPDVRGRQLTVQAGEAVIASGHERSLAQIVANLVINAGQATREQPSARITVRVERRAPRIDVVVEDDGPGVPEAARAQLFSAFFTTKPEGTGLGLSVSAALAEAMSARISHEPAEGGGARFRLSLAEATEIGTRPDQERPPNA